MSDNDDVVNERSRQLREEQYLAFLESSARERSGDDSSDEEAGNEEEQDGQEVDQPYEQLGDGNEEDEEFGEFAGPVGTPITHQMDDATLFQTVLDNLDRREKVGASMSDDDALFASSKPSAPVQAEPSRVTALAPLDPEKRALIMSAMQNFKPKGGARPALDVIADSIVRAHQGGN